MKRYLKVFIRVVFARAGKDMSLRANLIFEMLGSFIFFALHLTAFKIVVTNFRFPGWEISDLWILQSTFQIFTYLSFFLFWKGLTRTTEDIRMGTLDTIVIKPISPRFTSFLRSGGLHNLATSLAALVLLVYFLFSYGIYIKPLSALLYVASIILSLWLIHCLSVIMVSLNFFFGYLPETPGISFNVQESYKYPTSLYLSRGLLVRLMFIPLSLFTTVPTLLLLSRPVSEILLWVISVTFTLSVFSNWIWNKGLRSYSSASS